MATIDLSRSATDHRKHYKSVRAQMGVVLTDDHFNDNERIHGEEERRVRVDVIGPVGTPDGGFAISNPRITAAAINFDIGPGTYYTGGLRLDMEQTEEFQVQSDWLQLAPPNLPAPPAAGSKRTDLVYLETYLHPVSPVEDGETREMGLPNVNGPAHMRLRRRVRIEAGVADTECSPAWKSLIAKWKAAGLGNLNAQNELVPDVKLKVGFIPGLTADLCSPPVQGGYLGAANQAIRVQLTDSGHFTWGFDNAAPLYRVQVGVVAGKTVVTMLTEPNDQEHWPVSGQVVEILAWGSVLPNEEKTAAELGFRSSVDAPYDPDKKTFTLKSALPAGFGTAWQTRPDKAALAPAFFYMRVWDRGTDNGSAPDISLGGGGPVPLGQTGLNITITGPDLRAGDYWIIAARPHTPDRVVPWLLEQGRWPHGFRRFFAPLAVIEWDATGGAVVGTVVSDCRTSFPPLSGQRCCCTFTVGDGITSFGLFTRIQDAVDLMPTDGGEICLLAGVFKENVKMVGKHDIRIHGCGNHTIWTDSGRGSAPLLFIDDCQNIEVRDLRMEAPAVVAIRARSTPAGEANKHGLRHIDLDDMTFEGSDTSAIQIFGGQFIRIRRNEILFTPLGKLLAAVAPAGFSPGLFVRADDVEIEWNLIEAVSARRLIRALGGIQIGGGSERVRIQRNHILGGNGNGITLGSVTLIRNKFVGVMVDRYSDVVADGIPWFGGHFVIGPDGCIHFEPDPQNPYDPNDPRTPVSEGDLEDIRIIDNDIVGMGMNGIASLRFYSPRLGGINIRGLDIEENHIRHCLQIDLGEGSISPAIPIGLGGIALLFCEGLTVRNNWIENNGVSPSDPICGVYLYFGFQVTLEGNEIRDNGPQTPSEKPPAPGPRAGVWLGLVSTPLTDQPGDQMGMFAEGRPALLMTSNIVVSPIGPALHAVVRGQTLVADNELTSRGIEPRRDPNPKGSPLIEFGALLATVLGGVTVRIFNTGQPADLLTYFLGYSYTKVTFAPASSFVSNRRLLLLGGNIEFHGNQVLLAPFRRVETIVSSVLLLTFDDVSMQDNQSEARLPARTLAVNSMVFGVSGRTCANRFSEFPEPGLSALALGQMTCMTSNQGTRCMVAIGLPQLLVAHSNRSWADLVGNAPCIRAAKLVGTGLPKGYEAKAGNQE
jgi:hypothetical protein